MFLVLNWGLYGGHIAALLMKFDVSHLPPERRWAPLLMTCQLSWSTCPWCIGHPLPGWNECFACFACRAKGTYGNFQRFKDPTDESIRECLRCVDLIRCPTPPTDLLFLSLYTQYTECLMDLMFTITAEVGGFEVRHAGSRKWTHRQHMTSYDFFHAHRQQCLFAQFLCNRLLVCNASNSFYVFSEIILPLERNRA